MQFRLELQVKPFKHQLKVGDHVMLVGSCFTDHIGKRLKQYRFNVCENPNGILFNPVSISNAIESYIQKKKYTESDLFYYNELWQSWDHHSDYSYTKAEKTLDAINSSIEAAHEHLLNADFLILTLGSAFLYKLNSDEYNSTVGNVAANCHKIPQKHFNHVLATYEELKLSMTGLISRLRTFNPQLQLIFTISPVRHFREGLVENNRSKALLHSLVAEMESAYDFVQYFPSYELIIDDLRDYRFYAEDMVHPNHQATQYVWEKFTQAVIAESDHELLKQLHTLFLAINHKPMHPDTALHLKFLHTMHRKAVDLQQQYPELNLEPEIRFFEEAKTQH
ncbi:GSCFA domain-containing protein [Polluticaenibacter yanchengensis]|uniref:GSCFA domain-containing protein n=1 Tax=Polluticaenibacter yanchengensis TaxID=3014562 RepID=A0ABT4UIU0_9BACT|nr:GSCFA domain-containing protein [Chitinophagaceae bacterium LY-5]